MYNTPHTCKYGGGPGDTDGMVDQRWPTQLESSRPADGGVDQHEVTVLSTGLPGRGESGGKGGSPALPTYLNILSGPIGDNVRHYLLVDHSNVLYEVLYLYVKVL